MAKRLFDITSWYNNEATYPDLTLGLFGGSKIKVHKAIVFQESKYFEEYCAPYRLGQTVPMRGAAVGVELLVRTMYGFPVPEAADRSWAGWLLCLIVAERHRDLALSEQVRKNFTVVAFATTDVGEILNMIRFVENTPSLEMRDTIVEIRKHHAIILLDDENYRAAVDRDPELLKLHLDDLLAKQKNADNAT